MERNVRNLRDIATERSCWDVRQWSQRWRKPLQDLDSSCSAWDEAKSRSIDQLAGSVSLQHIAIELIGAEIDVVGPTERAGF